MSTTDTTKTVCDVCGREHEKKKDYYMVPGWAQVVVSYADPNKADVSIDLCTVCVLLIPDVLEHLKAKPPQANVEIPIDPKLNWDITDD